MGNDPSCGGGVSRPVCTPQPVRIASTSSKPSTGSGSKPIKTTFIYKREILGSGTFKNLSTGKTSSAHSGAMGSGLVPTGAIKNYGQTPVGTYEVKSCRSGPDSTGGIKRCDIVPKGHNALGRTHLQVHEPSTNKFKAMLNADSKGCIVTKGVESLKAGDTVVVRDK